MAEAIAAEQAGHPRKYLYFWGHQTLRPGCLPQWWPVTFTEDGQRYGSAEHYMMAHEEQVREAAAEWLAIAGDQVAERIYLDRWMYVPFQLAASPRGARPRGRQCPPASLLARSVQLSPRDQLCREVSTRLEDRGAHGLPYWTGLDIMGLGMGLGSDLVAGAGTYESLAEVDPLVRSIRIPAADFESGLVLTLYGKVLRWGAGWWIHQPERERLGGVPGDRRATAGDRGMGRRPPGSRCGGRPAPRTGSALPAPLFARRRLRTAPGGPVSAAVPVRAGGGGGGAISPGLVVGKRILCYVSTTGDWAFFDCWDEPTRRYVARTSAAHTRYTLMARTSWALSGQNSPVRGGGGGRADH